VAVGHVCVATKYPLNLAHSVRFDSSIFLMIVIRGIHLVLKHVNKVRLDPQLVPVFLNSAQIIWLCACFSIIWKPVI
jgi:hypothetical protein